MKKLAQKTFYAVIFGVVMTSCGVGRITQDCKTSNTVKVMTLGIFHFDFPMLDLLDDESVQIDVLLPEHQKEIERIVEKLAAFQPTIVVIERQSRFQGMIDSLYNEFLLGNHQLSRSETQQIGFRIAKKMGLKKLYCADEWGVQTENVIKFLSNQESEEFAAFLQSVENFRHSPIRYKVEAQVFKTEGILAELIRVNADEHPKRDLGNYLLDFFKFESTPGDFLGVDFITGNWFNRNLRIFRNIQRIETTPSDRILVIFGSSHMGILNILFDASPEYTLVRANDFLK
ncbi:MAG: DUF5694 domain-containing protein [Bacteroidales bacterium]|nr:DUF5694 domain-containing protein [Bacteroidales bacterium]